MAGEHDLTPERVRELLAAGEIQLIDVREPHEWEAGRIEGARHVELTQLSSEAASIDRGRPVVFQCRIGARSTMAAEAFRASGYEAFNLGGGILAWVQAGLPLIPDDGRVADH
ncbi:MAG: rhodanese-like domain-containing protein [Thermoleophilaceae bacterium]|nr:rhodanese-like domain-containing protein [Thermoleophilaceae bacterium]